MAEYESEVWAYQTFDQPDDVLWYDVPSGSSVRDHVDSYDVSAVWVRAWDADTGEERWFWVYSYMGLTWDEWDDVIAGHMEMYGLEVA